MDQHLHNWVGYPKLTDELGESVAKLSGSVTKIGDFDVVYPARSSSIDFLAKGFSEYRVQGKILNAAKGAGVQSASAMIGVRDYGISGWPFSTPGLIDLGSFALDRDDESEEKV